MNQSLTLTAACLGFAGLLLTLPLTSAVAENKSAASVGASHSATNASAQPPHVSKHQGGHHYNGQYREEVMRELNLSADQQQRIKEAHQKLHEENAALLETMRSQKTQLRELTQSKGKDAPETKALRRQLHQSHKTLREKRVAIYRNVLTPEQFAKWERLKAEKRAAHGGHTQKPSEPSQGAAPDKKP